MSHLPHFMRQIVFAGAGGPEVIRVEQAPIPMPARDQVLIKVKVAGVNRPDCLQRAGHYPPPPGESAVPGLEVSGTIVAQGADVKWPAIGAEVCALLGSGGYADYALAHAGLCLPRPETLSLTEAGALPENLFTVYDNVFTRGRLAVGESFLVHGGSSGIGSIALQMAKAFGAQPIFATAGSEEKAAFCRAMGADQVVNYKNRDFEQDIRAWAPKGIDVILDMVGGDYIGKNFELLAIEGRLVQIAFMKSAKVAQFNFSSLLSRRLTIMGSSLRPRSVELKSDIARALRQKIWPMIESGAILPQIFKIFTLDEAANAHALMEMSAHCGKILLQPEN